jgi:hypothetical protein
MGRRSFGKAGEQEWGRSATGLPDEGGDFYHSRQVPKRAIAWV